MHDTVYSDSVNCDSVDCDFAKRYAELNLARIIHNGISFLQGGGTDTCVGSGGSFSVRYLSNLSFLPLEFTKCSLHTLVESRMRRFLLPILCIHCFKSNGLLIGKRW